MKTIGKYQVIDTIDSGGMGIVHKAIDPRIERIVAVKTLSGRRDATPEMRKRLLAEARAAGALSHKNIVTIYEMDEDNGTAYIAMEFLDGHELEKLIAERTQFSIEQKLQIMVEICEGLAHAHSTGVIHRDIKPGNIFVTRSGQVKILDFGLAGLVSSEAISSGAGTPSYMSPEQVRREQVDHRSDIFSAGVLFYELLAYRKPFQGESDFSITYQICNSEPERIEQLVPEVPPAVACIIARALAKKPDERYQDVDGMLGDLNSVLDDIEQCKRVVRGEIDKELVRLEQLAAAHGAVLGEAAKRAPMLRREYVSLLSGSRQPTASGRLPLVEYRRLLELRDQARQDYEALSAVVERRNRSGYLLLEIEELRRAGHLDDALKLAEYVMSQDATCPGIVTLYEELRGQVDEARTTADTRDRQLRTKAALTRARAALGCGRLEAARNELQQALSLNPRVAEGNELLAEIERAEAERRACTEKEARIAQLLSEARRLNENSDRRKALAVVKQILELDPTNWYGVALNQELRSGKQQSGS